MITLRAASRLAGVVASVAIVAACDRSHGVRTIFIGDHPFTQDERRVIERIAVDAAREARQHLPALPEQLTVRAQSGSRVIQELGAMAEFAAPDYVVWTVDATRPEGVRKIAEAHLRVALLHEFHHLVRLSGPPATSPMDRIIAEGMATAFERDVAPWSPPWGAYPETVEAWVKELRALPSDAHRSDWLSRHADRRVTYKIGTYLVDQAVQKTGKTPAQLVSTPTEQILAAAAR